MSIIWLTGFSGSGKSTIAEQFQLKTNAPILDGDYLRKSQKTGKIHGIQGQEANQQARIALAIQLLKEHPIVVAAFVSPKKELRDEVQHSIEKQGHRFFLIHVNTSIEVCRQRDPKGLYNKLEKKQNIFLAGINVPYDVPENPRLICDTEKDTAETCAEKIVQLLSQESIEFSK
jgi:adenylylsulfate kinase-like enzyme